MRPVLLLCQQRGAVSVDSGESDRLIRQPVVRVSQIICPVQCHTLLWHWHPVRSGMHERVFQVVIYVRLVINVHCEVSSLRQTYAGQGMEQCLGCSQPRASIRSKSSSFVEAVLSYSTQFPAQP